MSSILEIENLSVFYGAIPALKNVTIRIGEGEIVSLVGSNGAGKSTLMKTILGLTAIKSGVIRYQSHPIQNLSSHEVVRLGISQSPEGREIFADMSVYENLLLGAYSKRMSKVQMRGRIDEIFSIFPLLKDRQRQMAGTLSGGEQQMLAIGRALMTSPSLLLLDEPSLGISPLLTEKIFEVLVRLNQQGTSMLLAEQNAALALEISHRGYVLELGQIIHQDKAAHLLSNDIIRRTYLGV